MRLYLTRNVQKDADFVNGMRCTVEEYDADADCIVVKTDTGKRVTVFRYNDPDWRGAFFPIRVGYASTIFKLQGATLKHVTIWLDRPESRAAGYVAISRVRRDADYLFGGRLTPAHFKPA